MRGYVGITDLNWYEYLATRKDITEVNFWRPKDQRRFNAIGPDDFFFFKTKAPHSLIVGGGLMAGWELLPLSAAWEFFGEGNGAANIDSFRKLIGGKKGLGTNGDPEIGCIVLRDVKFFAPGTNMAMPPGLLRNGTQQGKTFDLDEPPFSGLFDILTARVLGADVEIGIDHPTWKRDGPMFQERIQKVRMGQGEFRARVLNAYRRRCAITGTRIWPVLQAAHIRPVDKGGEHRLDNGLLLRSDAHKMFDDGYLGLHPAHKLLVSPRLRSDFGNGEQFYARAGEVIDLPDRQADRPNREFLEWHRDTVFKSA